MSNWNDNDTKKETGDSGKAVKRASHDAHDDAVQSGDLPERNENKVKDSEHGPSLHETFKKAGMVSKKK